MTEDEQEALSFRYVMPRIARLSSGRFALLVDGRDLQIIEREGLLEVLDFITCANIEAYNESLRVSRPEPPARITSLNLADLGL